MSDGRLPAGLIIEAPWPEGEAAAWATAEERAAAAAFGSERRRREYLTWRALVRRELGRDVHIAYDAVGAPVLENRPEHLSVSHCDGRVAVCLSLRRCAVDIEPVTRNFGRVLSRYMTPEEQALADDPLLPAAVWCAKETLYKYAGRRSWTCCATCASPRRTLQPGVLRAALPAERRLPCGCCAATAILRPLFCSTGPALLSGILRPGILRDRVNPHFAASDAAFFIAVPAVVRRSPTLVRRPPTP